MRFTHERSWNEDCIVHVRIPFFNWIKVFLWIDWKITIFFRWTKSILRKFTHNTRNHLHGALRRGANQLLQGSHPLSRIFTSTRKWWSRRVDCFMNSSFWHSPVPWNIWQPQSSIEKVNDFVPCIKRQRFTRFLHLRRQRFTRIVKAPKRISCHLELGNLNFHVPIMCKPMYTATHRGENRYMFKIVVVVV